MNRGETQSEAARRRISEGKRLGREGRLREDQVALRALGQTNKFDFAERMDTTPRTAKIRLDRLVDAGLAYEWIERGHRAPTYAVTIPPGVKQIVSRRRRKP